MAPSLKTGPGSSSSRKYQGLREFQDQREPAAWVVGIRLEKGDVAVWGGPAKHIVKAFVYRFCVPKHRYVLNLRRLLESLLYIPFSERWCGVNQVKILAVLETTGAKTEKTRPASPTYERF